MIHITAFFTVFAFVFLRVFQQKNIHKNHYGLMILTSFAMTATEIITITLIVTRGWNLYPSLALGGASGCVLAVLFHKKYFGDKKMDIREGCTYYHPVTKMYYRFKDGRYQFKTRYPRAYGKEFVDSGMNKGFVEIGDK